MATRRKINIQTSAIVPSATIILSTVLLTIMQFVVEKVFVRICSVILLGKNTGLGIDSTGLVQIRVWFSD